MEEPICRRREKVEEYIFCPLLIWLIAIQERYRAIDNKICWDCRSKCLVTVKLDSSYRMSGSDGGW